MEIVFRVVKAVVMAAIMASAIWALTGSTRMSMIASFIPFVLGITNILAGFAYSITAVALISL